MARRLVSEPLFRPHRPLTYQQGTMKNAPLSKMGDATGPERGCGGVGAQPLQVESGRAFGTPLRPFRFGYAAAGPCYPDTAALRGRSKLMVEVSKRAARSASRHLTLDTRHFHE
jgi:hypothetical protein